MRSKSVIAVGLVALLALLILALPLLAGCTKKPTPTPTSTPSPTVTPTRPAPSATPTPLPSPTPTELPVANWIMASSGEGTFGFETAVGLARIAEKYAKGVKLTVVPGYSTTASHTVYDKGESNIAYVSLLGIEDAYLNKGAFAKSPVTYRVYHGLYFFNSIHMVMTTKDRKDINSFRDLVGKKFFPFTTGSVSHLLALKVFGPEGLGIWDKMTERQLGTGEITDAVRNKVVDAVWVYVVGGQSLTATFQDLELRTDLKIVEPSAEEKAIITKIPGVVAPYYIDAKVFSKPVGVDKIWGVAGSIAYTFGPAEDEERVYRLIKAWYEHRDELVALNSGFAELSDKGLELTSAAIDALPDIPVHPGMARYLKEKGLWKDSWKIGQLYPRPKK